MFSLLIVLIAFVNCCCTRDLPSYIHTCSRNDPYLENCLVNAFNTLRPFARNGIEELYLPSLNPLVVEKFYATQENSLVNYTFSSWNMTALGLDNFNIKEIKYDSTINETFRINADFDLISVVTGYKMKGRLLDIPIDGNGLAQALFAPGNAMFEIIGEIRNTSNGEFYHIRDVNVKIKLHCRYLYFNGLFNNNERLENMINNIINDNKQIIVDATTSVLENLAEKGIMKFMRSLTKAFSYQQLLPRSNNYA